MKFSVVIPCHNAGPYIGEALRSVAEQTHPPHEVIVIDDASTDDSVKIVESSPLDVRLLHCEHRNGAATRNVGIEAATGDWIAFLDADDLWLPEHLAYAREVLSGSTDVALHGHRYVMREGVRIAEENPWPPERPTPGLPAEAFVDFFESHLIFNTSSIVMDRRRLLNRGMFDPAFVRRHDMEMWLRVTEGATWAYDPRPTMVYRADSPGSISRVNWASSELWHLKMLLHCRRHCDTAAMRRLIRHAARRTMASALTDGDKEDRERAWALAAAHLASRDRRIFAVARHAPALFASANRIKRRRTMSRNRANRTLAPQSARGA